MSYAFDCQVIKELGQFLRTSEELDSPRSFMPYLRDLNLSSKSPYSASNNSSTHFWLHAIGVLTAVSRSANAKSFGTTKFRELLNQAISVAYCLRLSGIHSIGYSLTPDGPSRRAAELETPTSSTRAGAPGSDRLDPVNTHPDTVFSFTANLLPRQRAHMEQWAWNRVQALTDIREGTVAHKLRELLYQP